LAYGEPNGLLVPHQRIHGICGARKTASVPSTSQQRRTCVNVLTNAKAWEPPSAFQRHIDPRFSQVPPTLPPGGARKAGFALSMQDAQAPDSSPLGRIAPTDRLPQLTERAPATLQPRSLRNLLRTPTTTFDLSPQLPAAPVGDLSCSPRRRRAGGPWRRPASCCTGPVVLFTPATPPMTSPHWRSWRWGCEGGR
jgi:hypothetical protein